MTIGIVEIAFLTAAITGVAAVTIASTFSRASSAASAGTRSILPSAQRSSSARFLPSIQPCSFMPARNASSSLACDLGDPPVSQPTRRSFSCANA